MEMKILRNRPKHIDRHYLFFILITSIFLIFSISSSILNYFYRYGLVFGVTATAIFLIYAVVYLLERQKKRRRCLLDCLFAAFLVNMSAMVAYSALISGIFLYSMLTYVYITLVYAVMIIVAAFPFFIGAYLIRNKISTKLGIVFLALAVILLAIYFVSGLVVKSYAASDETFVVVREITYALRGINPYNYSLARQLYANRTLMGIAVTTNNTVIGRMPYPALYMLLNFPFYVFAYPPTIHNIGLRILPSEVAVFMAFLFIVIVFSIDKERAKYPILGLMSILALLVSYSSFIPNYILMLAMLVLAYKSTGTKYSWLLFGLCISIQEFLWIPIVMLIAYTFNNYGFKKGFYDVALALLVFLAINGYFIAQGPQTFFSSIFMQIKLIIAPNNSSFGFLMQSIFPLLQGTYQILFGVAILLMLAAYVYTNKKYMLGLFGMVPFAFMFFAQARYYAFFAVLLFITMFISEKGKSERGTITKFLRSNRKLLAFAVLFLLAVSALAILASHYDFARRFDIRVSGQRIYYDSALNRTVYSANMSYGNLSCGHVYFTLFYYTGKFDSIGIGNHSVIASNATSCNSSDIQCASIQNRISLNGSGVYHMAIYLANGNDTKNFSHARMLIYNGDYIYISKYIRYKGMAN